MTCVLSPTGFIPWFSKTEGNTYATLLHYPLLFGEIQHSAQEVARRISCAVAGEVRASRDLAPDIEPFLAPLPGRSLLKSRHTKYPSQTHLPRIYIICLSFSSPPLHPCRFIRPLFPNLLLSLSLAFFRLLVCWITCYHGAR